MSKMLPFDKIEMCNGHLDFYIKILDEILNTPDDSDIRYFFEVDLKYPVNIKEKTKKFPICPESKIIAKDKHNAFMKKIKPKNYTKI